MKKHSLFLLFIFISCVAFGQVTVTGVVTDGATNETIIGAPVKVKNKPGVGVITDYDGRYSISASPQDVLEFSYMGMTAQEITVGNQTTINVTLMPDTKQLDELVVIGYGQVKKSDLTGAVAVVPTEELTKRTTGSAAQAIQGLAPGVVVVNSSRPGGGSTIRVRGVGSISSSSDPLVVIDGVVGGALHDLQPGEIENIQILKDASASAIYGANGSNGVVIVTTKRGKSGAPTLSLNSFATYNVAPQMYKLMNADEYVDFYKPYVGNLSAFDPTFREKYYGENWHTGTDWQSLLFRDSWSQNHSLSISAGNDKSNYSINLGVQDNNGTIIKNNSQVISLRANSDFRLSNYLKIGESLRVRHIKNTTDGHSKTTLWSTYTSPLMKVYNPNYKGGYESPKTQYYFDANGDLQQLMSDGSPGVTYYTNTGNNDKVNPYGEPMMMESYTKNILINASVYLQIDFTDWLMFKTMPSAIITTPRSFTWQPTWTGLIAQNSSAILDEGFSMNTNVAIENQLLFNKLFNDTHNVQATIVQTASQKKGESIQGVQNGFPDEYLNILSKGGINGTTLSGGRSTQRSFGLLGRLIYDYKSKYYLTASVRRDGVSFLAPMHRTGTFAAASAAWKINEDFLKDVRAIDFLKLRVGWGQTGNSSVGMGLYDYQDNVTGNLEISPVFGSDQHVAWAEHIFYGMGSSSVGWETAEMTNIGLDWSLWNGKLQGSFEYYNKDVKDLLTRLPISGVFGRHNANPWVNLGQVRNSGIDFNATWKDKFGALDYSIMTNISTVKNKVISLITPVIAGPWPLSGTNRTYIGRTIGELYGYVSEGIIQPGDDYANYPLQDDFAPQPGDIKFKDLNGDGIINDKDRTFIGKTIPTITYSLGINLAYSNFDFSAFFYGVGDFDVYNYQRTRMATKTDQDQMHNKLAEYAANHFTAERPSTKYVRFDEKNKNDRISTFWLEDGSFLRLKDIQLGYSIPKNILKKLFLKNLRVYANASNLLTLTSYKGIDPEPFMSTSPTTSGNDLGGYSLPKSFSFGLQIGF